MLPFQLSTVYLCTTWRLDPKALALLPSFLHCGFLAACAKDMVFQGLTCLLPWTPKLGDSKIFLHDGNICTHGVWSALLADQTL
jgi:hypothetical protein